MLLMGQTFEIENVMYLQVLKPQESENKIFSGWSVCEYVSVLPAYLTSNNTKN